MFASATLSETVLNSRGLGVEMSSRASLTAAMMAAAINERREKTILCSTFVLLACDGAAHLAHVNKVGEYQGRIVRR